MGRRISDIDPATIGIKCRHRAKTRRAWNLCPKCYFRYMRAVAPEKWAAYQEKQKFFWKKYADLAATRERLRQANEKRPQWKKRDTQLRRQYGISIFQYNVMLRQQEGRCWICQREFVRRLHTDHDHTTGRVRGLLCWWCNQGLRYFRDSATDVERALTYLTRDFDGRTIEPERSILGKLIARAQKAGESIHLRAPNGTDLVSMTPETFCDMYGQHALDFIEEDPPSSR